MTSEKSKKKKAPKAKAKKVEKKAESAKPTVVFTRKPIISAEKYLKSAGKKARHIMPLRVWANSQGYTQETAARWKEIFSKV